MRTTKTLIKDYLFNRVVAREETRENYYHGTLYVSNMIAVITK